MKARLALGFILIVIGALALAYQGFTYTTQKKAIDIGSIQVNRKEHHAVFVPPVLGAIALAVGVIVILTNRRVP